MQTEAGDAAANVGRVSYIALILSGAALLLNGLALLGRVSSRDSGWFNLLIGGTQLVLAVAIAAGAAGDRAILLSVSGVFLFGLTYLYVGVDALRGLGSAGLGWFCGLVAVLALVYSGLGVATDAFLAVLWLSWAMLWALFFAILALGARRATVFTGWAAILLSQVTTTVPALLGLLGAWPSGPLATLGTLGLVVALVSASGVLAARSARTAQVPAGAAGATA